MSFDLESYVGVDERIQSFAEKYPTGCLRPLDPAKPYEVLVIGERTWIVVVAAAFRTPDDPTPGVGMAWEQYPGKTPYTRDSELQNAETSAWGRALVAVLAADTKRGVASRQEVEARRVESPPAASNGATHTTDPSQLPADDSSALIDRVMAAIAKLPEGKQQQGDSFARGALGDDLEKLQTPAQANAVIKALERMAT